MFEVCYECTCGAAKWSGCDVSTYVLDYMKKVIVT